MLSLCYEPEVLATAHPNYNLKCCQSAMNQRSWQQYIPTTTESRVTLLRTRGPGNSPFQLQRKVLSLYSEPEVLATAHSNYNRKCCHSAMNKRSWQHPIPTTTKSVVTLLLTRALCNSPFQLQRKEFSLCYEPEVLATAHSNYNGKCCHCAMNQRSWQQPIPTTT